MSGIRVVGLFRVTDPEVGLPLLQQIADIASDIDGVEVWEAFSDGETGLVYLNEQFDSEETYLRYESAVDAEGLRPQIGEAFELEHLLLQSPIENEQLKAHLDALGTVTVKLLAASDQTPTE